MMNSMPISTYKPRITTSEAKEMMIPRSKAMVSIQPGTIRSALIFMFIAMARDIVERTK